MKRTIATVLLAVSIAAIWGYFADLRNGQVEWFAGRLVFVALVAVQRLLTRRSSGAR